MLINFIYKRYFFIEVYPLKNKHSNQNFIFPIGGKKGPFTASYRA
jgi:hypothetical protein